MGNKGAKGKLPNKAKLTSKDLKALEKQTGLPKAQIEQIFQKFMENNPGKIPCINIFFRIVF
jgi:hypothetical protein